MTTTSNRHVRTKPNIRKEAEEVQEQVQEVTSDLVNYVTEYAKEKPGHVALFCLGIGFVLGWKLKPW